MFRVAKQVNCPACNHLVPRGWRSSRSCEAACAAINQYARNTSIGRLRNFAGQRCSGGNPRKAPRKQGWRRAWSTREAIGTAIAFISSFNGRSPTLATPPPSYARIGDRSAAFFLPARLPAFLAPARNAADPSRSRWRRQRKCRVVEKGADRRDRIAIEFAIDLFRHIADVRRRQHIGHAAEGMVEA